MKRKILLGSGLLLLLLFFGGVIAFVYRETHNFKKRDTGLYIERYGKTFVEDAKALAGTSQFPEENGQKDAGPWLNTQIVWTHLPAESSWKNPPALSKEVRNGLSDWIEIIEATQGKKDDPEFRERWKEIAASLRSSDSYDLSWMGKLRGYDHWNLEQNGPLGPGACPVEEFPTCGIYGGPAVNFIDLFDKARLRLYRASRDKDFSAALEEIHQLSRLLVTTEKVLPVKIGLLLSTLGERVKNLTTVPDFDLGDWEAATGAQNYLSDRFYRDGAPFLVPRPNDPRQIEIIDSLPRKPLICPLLQEGAGVALLASPFLEPHVLLESNYQRYYEAMDQVLRQTEGICRLNSIRSAWKERLRLRQDWRRRLFEPVKGSDPKETDSSMPFKGLPGTTPYFRRWIGQMICQIATPLREEYGSEKPKVRPPKTPSDKQKSKPSLKPGPEIVRHSESHYSVRQEFRDSSLLNLAKVLESARAVPEIDPATSAFRGFRILSLAPSSLFRKLGIRQGDILTEINGVILDNAGKGLEAFQVLREAKIISVKLLRGRQQFKIRYDLE